MANINIPPSVVPGIKAIGLLDNQESDLLIETLRGFEKGSSMDLMRESFETFLSQENAELISSAIYSFGYLLVRNENINGDLSENLSKSFLKLTIDDDVSQGLGDKIQERLHDILVLSDFLIPTFEAYRVMWENNTVLKSADFTSEIVLLNDKSYTTPASGVFVNKLNLVLRGSDEGEDSLSVILDTDDLELLKSKIEIVLRENEQMKRAYGQFINFITI